MKIKVKFVKKFPRINYDDNYLVLNRYKNHFHILYEQELKEYMKLIAEYKSFKFNKTLKTNKPDNKMKLLLEEARWEDLIYYPRLRETLIIQDELNFKSFSGWNDYFKYVDSNESFKLYKANKKNRSSYNGPAPYQFVSIFVLNMVRDGVLLSPLYNTSLIYTQSKSLKKDIELSYAKDSRYLDLKETVDNHFKSSNVRLYVFFIILLSTTISGQELEEEELNKIIQTYSDNKYKLSRTLKSTKDRVTDDTTYTTNIMKALPGFFVKNGAKVSSLMVRKRKNKNIEQVVDIQLKKIESTNFKNKYLIEHFKVYLRKIYLVGNITIGTVEDKAKALRDFFNALENYLDGKNLTRDRMDKFLDYPEENFTFQHILKEKYIKNGNALPLIRLQGVVIDFLDSTSTFYGSYKKNSRLKFRDTGATLIRESLDEEVYDIIIDILLNRPPEMREHRKWGNKKVDWSNWWPHKTPPFLPIALLLHLHLPLRSAHILNLDRDNFLVKNNDGTIRGYYINTDKNTSRTEAHIIPNIYKEALKVIENLIQLNKDMYPNLQMVKYQHDENSPWEKFFPLFPNEDGDDIMSKGTYSKYFKTVVLTAQLELYKKGRDIKIAWLDDVDAFPYSISVIENLRSKYLHTSVKTSFGLHSLRVTGATRLLKMGLPPQIIRLFTGHKSVSQLINIYLKIPNDELIESYFKIRDKINTSEIEGLKKCHKDIPKTMLEYIPSENPEEILKELKRNNMFTMERKNILKTITIIKKNGFIDGLKYMSTIHHSHWQSFHFGICGKPDGCPIGADNRCSLCSYLATGPLYLHGVITKCEQVQKRVFVQSNLIAKNRLNNIHQENRTLHKQQSLDLEELAGWYEIISMIEHNMNIINKDSIDKKDLTSSKSSFQLVFYNPIPEMEGLIELYKKAKKLNINNTDTEDTIFRLSTKIIRWCMKNKKISDIQEILDEPKKVIDWFIPNTHISNHKKHIE